MKSNSIWLFLIFLLGIPAVHAQQKTSLSIKDAVAMALEKSDAVGLATTKVATKSYELQSIKNNRYPDVKLSGQYMRLTNANVNLKTKSNSDPNATPTEAKPVNQLLLGQANMTLPLFSGFKLKNTIEASESLYQSELAHAEYSKEETAMQVIRYYAALYKAQKTVELLKESMKSSQQRVTDFTSLEQNGVIARNDLLKSQLQVSKIQLSLDDSEKNVKVINAHLISLLKLPAETQIEVQPNNIDPNLFNNVPKTEAEAISSRNDLKAIGFLHKASESGVKIAKSGYYPSLAFTAGFIALDLQNVVTVQNAMNVGVGFSYNLSSLFKNGKDVKVAKSKAFEVDKQQAEMTDAIKLEILSAREDYELSVKQDKVYGESVEQTTENYRIVKDKYDNGLSNTNDLLEADVDQLSSKINQTNAKANVALKYYELLKSSGQLLDSFNLSKN